MVKVAAVTPVKEALTQDTSPVLGSKEINELSTAPGLLEIEIEEASNVISAVSQMAEFSVKIMVALP